MSIRTFIFCDRCNPQGIRTINRRNCKTDEHHGRRNYDGRAWFEGSIEEGINSGWAINSPDEAFCPRCAEKGLAELANPPKDTKKFEQNSINH